MIHRCLFESVFIILGNNISSVHSLVSFTEEVELVWSGQTPQSFSKALRAFFQSQFYIMASFKMTKQYHM